MFILINACSSIRKNIPDPKNKFIINFGSIYDDELLTLIINDSLYFNNELIETNRSLGIDPAKEIIIYSNEVEIDINFNGVIVEDFQQKRTLEKDTILDIDKGSFVLISAKGTEIIFEQQKKIFILD